MTTLAEIDSQLRQLGERKDQIDAETERIRTDIFRINRQRIAAKNSGDASAEQELEQQLTSLRQQRDSLFNEREQIDAEQNRLNSQYQEIQQSQVLTPAPSAGATVQQAQTAKDDGANTQEPEQSPPQVVTAEGRVQPDLTERPSNATPSSEEIQDSGTNEPVVTQEQTQAPVQRQPPNNTGPIPAARADAGPNVPIASGTASPRDDQVSASNATVQEINSVFANQTITPQPNELDKYGSYTYSLSWYIMSPEDYNRIVDQGKLALGSNQLLMQSGGAANQDRNPLFTLDYYLDNLEMKSLIAGRGALAAHNVTEMSFTVKEPAGLTFMDNLYYAIVDFNQRTGTPDNTNYAAQHYLMVIRYYGYDENGNQVQASGGYGSDTADNALVVKYIPFIIKNVGFTLQDNAVNYRVEAAPVPYPIAASSVRGSVPFNIELSGKDVKTLLAGTKGQTPIGTGLPAGTDGRESLPPPPEPLPEATPGLFELELGLSAGESIDSPSTAISNEVGPAKANAAPSKTAQRGLMEALNQFQEELKKRGTIDEVDVYKIEFANPSIADSKIRKQGGLNKNVVPFKSADSNNKGENKIPEKVTPDTDNRNFGIVAGTQIIQVIDQVIRMSQFIDDQAKVTRDEATGELRVNPGTKTPAWFKIGMRTKALKFDKKRNDHAYEITFVISLYAIQDLESVYFESPNFRGVHKQYAYWFTGENTQILKFEQNFNKLWTLVLQGNPQLQNQTSNSKVLREQPKRAYFVASGQSSQGAGRGANEPGANAADYLYSPADQGEVNLTIVGDPAWIQQGEIAKGATAQNFNFRPFNADGGINYEAQQVLFEIRFRKPSDYDPSTGLLTPAGTEQSYVYLTKSVTHKFDQGSFTQELSGSLMMEELIKPTPSQPETQRTVQRAKAPASRAPSVANNDRPERVYDGVAVSGELGAYFGSGETDGAVNFQPTPLSEVLDNQRTGTTGTTGLASNWDAEGFGAVTDPSPSDSRGAVSAGSNVADNTFVTGQSTTSSEAVTARPENSVATSPVGITIALNNGQTQFVTTPQQINSLVNDGLIRPESGAVYRSELRALNARVRSTVTNNNRIVKEF